MNYKDLEKVLDFADVVIADFDKSSEKNISLLCLLHAEDIIDKGRVIGNALESSEEDRARVVSRMDNLRAKIVELKAQMDPKELENMLFAAGENFKSSFKV